MSLNFKMDGFKQLERSLSKLPKELSSGVERTALRTAAKPIEKKAKASAPTGTGKHSGLLKKSIGITVKKQKKGRNSGNLSARIGIRTGFKVSLGMRIARVTKGKRVIGQAYEAFKDPTKYAHLVEFGTSREAAKPFMRPAAEGSRGEVASLLAKGYDKGLARIVKKIKKS